MMHWPVSLWSDEWFWRAIELSASIARAAEPNIQEEFLRNTILKEWLALSLPAGNA